MLGLIQKLLSVKQIFNKEASEKLRAIHPGLETAATDYLNHFNSVSAHSRYVTSAFIREVYYATMQHPLQNIPVESMKERLESIEKERASLRKYEILEVEELRPKQTVSLTVNRKFSNRSENKVTYLLEQVAGQWKVNHIARIISGTVLEVNRIDGQTAYVVGDSSHAMLFLDTNNYDLRVSEQVTVRGYLETSYYLQDSFFYHIVHVQK
ncbi:MULTISPECIES: hypothetical protein [unclassified Paenibacillus]|uniref:hypothetical protein n=1 Tax=unclassified Paenibacillus TaxID=185978 RepID=UPI0010528920|nr:MULTISPECIES: hypothetical protein [unclassified Paenibacillus]NIK69351.1 hypothetical protein [Paenibacillus sp. BK720]TCM92692.1 hypothetical protein EV294_10880 [Paenibacillus sp. BK033]